jgi:hypothetical protein
MIELLNNSVTIIAGILSAFFLTMAIARRMARKRLAAQTKPAPVEERYTVVDPFEPVDETAVKTDSEPAELKSKDPVPDSASPARAPNLVEYRPKSRTAVPDNAETSGYVWE